MYTIDIHYLALEELNEAYNWYEDRANGLGKRLMNKVDKRISEITLHPNRYSKKKGNSRSTSIEIFPYIIIYEVIEKEKTIFISYIHHAKRNPKNLYKRFR